ncbi:MAG: anhydro-N-acetylmuramic acid kinase [Bacteroidetes bacterium]|nr:anhydro-N-acetylmuramic acid kinase [Bacteroidota bacterium]
MHTYHVIGTMSGTSLDGLDVALCRFTYDKGHWQYAIIAATTYSYDPDWKSRLAGASSLSGRDLTLLHKEFGRFTGEKVAGFLKETGEKAELIASHGHTVFHQPDKRMTLQIGDGSEIAAVTGLPAVCDFRSADVALGGQGAPLVPIGDELLFGKYGYCLNLGGFANISFRTKNVRLAFDICPVNIVLNRLACEAGEEFDRNGQMAASGEILTEMLAGLNSLDYYKKSPPKSLGREWFETVFLPLLDVSEAGIQDKLRTVCEHIAVQVAMSVQDGENTDILVTGGGAFNIFLIGLLRKHCAHEIVLPDTTVINFREALIFAFLGLLRVRNEVNCLSSVTGAVADHSGGCIYQPF